MKCRPDRNTKINEMKVKKGKTNDRIRRMRIVLHP